MSDWHANDWGYYNTMHMVRCLSNDITCPRRISVMVTNTFGHAPSQRAIKEVLEVQRKRAEKARTEPMQPHEGHNPSTASDALKAANRVFLERMWDSHRRIMRVHQEAGRQVVEV